MELIGDAGGKPEAAEAELFSLSGWTVYIPHLFLKEGFSS